MINNNGPTLSGEDHLLLLLSSGVGNATWASGGSGPSRQSSFDSALPFSFRCCLGADESSRRKSERAGLM